jgi:hypothetical protein
VRSSSDWNGRLARPEIEHDVVGRGPADAVVGGVYLVEGVVEACGGSWRKGKTEVGGRSGHRTAEEMKE